ncbi:hypothetical protein BCF46_3613 [Litoreibacter meonggei]|uniref:Tetratricopeptide repeat protein n=1 Tax=Litoreibacter meonggei TaxID=1049199 RepID=A0A497VFQ1_9RHOB|nr:hypothetical protein [Litoreibacter meonggei]RLJ41037.1 hypothetical protein BCF46_3613 [Litoreibacter meonggei]
MNRQNTPSAFYALSEKFDYRAYLEERSHTDRLVMAVDDQTAAIIGSGEQLGVKLGVAAQVVSGQIERSGQAIEARLAGVDDTLIQIDQHMMEGFSVVTMELRGLGDKLYDLNETMNLGFDRLSEQLQLTNELLTELVDLLKKPDGTWSLEMFRAAQEQTDLRNWPEALEFSTKAIEGDDHHSGFKLEPSFYYLRGKIHEGMIGTDLDHVDIEAAKHDFLNAVRFLPNTKSFFKKQALTRVGWCCYCLKELEEAEKHLISATQLAAQVPEADYLLAKVRLRLGKVDQVEGPLKIAVQSNSLFAFRAVNDADFIDHIGLVRGWFSNARDELLSNLRSWKDGQMHPKALRELKELDTGANNLDPEFELLIKELETLEMPLTLSESVDYKDRIELLEAERERLIDLKTKSVNFQVNYLLGQRTSTVIPNVEVHRDTGFRQDTRFGSVAGGGVLGWLVGIAIAIFNNDASGVTWFLNLVFGVIIYGILFAVVGLICGWIFGLFAAPIADGRRMDCEVEEKTKSQEEAKKEFRSEEQLVKSAHSEANALKSGLEAALERLRGEPKQMHSPEVKILQNEEVFRIAKSFHAGNRVGAIKEYRELTGANFQQAVDFLTKTS